MPKRYDNVRIVNPVDGQVIEGHEAVEEWFDRERKLQEEHGSTINFQLYRVDPKASSLTDLQGPILRELSLGGGEISGEDTVSAVREKVLPALLGDHAGAKHATFFFAGSPMREDARFYADHFMMLPAWVQVALHDCTFEELIVTMERLAEGEGDSREP